MSLEEVAVLSAKIFQIILVIAAVLFSYRIFYMILGFGKKIRFKKTKNKHKFAILIPARNESQVIKDIFEALKNQVYDPEKFDVFVVVKDPADKTIEIAKSYNYTAWVEPNQTCKGDALDSIVRHIYESNLQYDAFIIFDADNIPAENFLFEMNKALDAGYDIGMGYRNSKNWNDGWVANSSALTFSIINTLTNKGRTKLGFNNIFSGTGYFIKESVIANFKCWPFKTLTEDYEISLYATLNNLKTTYVEKAEYYDEQPSSLKQSMKQRERWVKGFSQVRKIYMLKIFKSLFTRSGNKLSKLDQLIGVLPLAITVADVSIYLLLQIAFIISALAMNLSPTIYIIRFCAIISAVYVILMIFTIIMLVAERKRINISFGSKIICVLANPFFMLTYLPIGIKILFSKNIGWETINHTKTSDSDNEEKIAN